MGNPEGPKDAPPTPQAPMAVTWVSRPACVLPRTRHGETSHTHSDPTLGRTGQHLTRGPCPLTPRSTPPNGRLVERIADHVAAERARAKHRGPRGPCALPTGSGQARDPPGPCGGTNGPGGATTDGIRGVADEEELHRANVRPANGPPRVGDGCAPLHVGRSVFHLTFRDASTGLGGFACHLSPPPGEKKNVA